MANTTKTSSTVAISKRTKGKLPSLPFETIKDAILGKSYNLSLVFAGDTVTRRLNKTYRGKDTIPNVLSFPLSKTDGEIFINPHKVKKEKKVFDMSEKECMAFLFIHGLLHLKGLSHGSIMERKERALLKRFLVR